MTDITTYPLMRHLRGTPTMHVRHLRRGQLVHDGTGLAFFFRPLSAVLSEVPVDDRELPLLFHARTADFHDLTVQASVTFRVTDPATACARLDFSIDPRTGRWLGTPLEQLAGLLAETAQQQVLGLIAASPMERLLAEGIGQIRDRILQGLTADSRLAETGIAVIGARVVALRPEPEVEKALQTPARELLQQEADRATDERRALAVERERAIAENELQNQIELARREEQLVAQRGANARLQAEEAAGASRIEVEALAVRELRLAQARAEGTRVAADAGPLLVAAAGRAAGQSIEVRSMVEAIVDDGQRLVGLNEVYIGQPTHQTARYTLAIPGGHSERQASSGLIVCTGTGATGWARSAWLERRSTLNLPGPSDRRLTWFVREAWPSPITGTDRTDGALSVGQFISVSIESDRLVAFSDGIESDAITLSWGQRVSVGLAQRVLRLVR